MSHVHKKLDLIKSFEHNGLLWHKRSRANIVGELSNVREDLESHDEISVFALETRGWWGQTTPIPHQKLFQRLRFAHHHPVLLISAQR